MLFKTIAHSWASAKLEKEVAHTQSLLHELERASAAANQNIQAKQGEYSDKIKAHQAARTQELRAHVEFMNQQLEITAGYLPELEQLQDAVFACLESWVDADWRRQQCDTVSQTITTTKTTIGLLDAYIGELNQLSQRQQRHEWRKLTAARELTVTNGFVQKTKGRIDDDSKSNRSEFKDEISRLRSHRSALKKRLDALYPKRDALYEAKRVADEQHETNKQALAERHRSCVERWQQIAKRFKAYYAFKNCELKYANEWLAGLEEGGTLPEIIKVIKTTAQQSVQHATQHYDGLEQERKRYAAIVQQAHDRKDYPNTFANDKAQRDSFKHQASVAWEDLQQRKGARSFLYDRSKELSSYIDRIKPLHPDAAINALCEKLSADHAFNTWPVFGINTGKQKRAHWQRKQGRIEHATEN